jgi:hypothetical protein
MRNIDPSPLVFLAKEQRNTLQTCPAGVAARVQKQQQAPFIPYVGQGKGHC